jgi:hypothetical protein
MKTLKTAIIATFLAFSIVSIASADGFKAKKVVNISFEKAIQNPGLVLAMHQQLNPDVLGNNQQVYVLPVVYQGITYKISGTYEQWKLFFTPKWNIGSESNPSIIRYD